MARQWPNQVSDVDDGPRKASIRAGRVLYRGHRLETTRVTGPGDCRRATAGRRVTRKFRNGIGTESWLVEAYCGRSAIGVELVEKLGMCQRAPSIAAASAKEPEEKFPYKEVLILLGVNLTEPIVMAVLFPSKRCASVHLTCSQEQ